MYLTKEIKPEDLLKVKIRKQPEIVQKTGERLEPKSAYQLLKEESNNFEKQSELLLKIDSKMAELFVREGILNPNNQEKQDGERERYRIRAMAELAEMELLNLELELGLELD